MAQELTKYTAEQAEQYGVPDALRLAFNKVIQRVNDNRNDGIAVDQNVQTLLTTVAQQQTKIQQLQTAGQNLLARVEALEAIANNRR